MLLNSPCPNLEGIKVCSANTSECLGSGQTLSCSEGCGLWYKFKVHSTYTHVICGVNFELVHLTIRVHVSISYIIVTCMTKMRLAWKYYTCTCRCVLHVTNHNCTCIICTMSCITARPSSTPQTNKCTCIKEYISS